MTDNPAKLHSQPFNYQLVSEVISDDFVLQKERQGNRAKCMFPHVPENGVIENEMHKRCITQLAKMGIDPKLSNSQLTHLQQFCTMYQGGFAAAG